MDDLFSVLASAGLVTRRLLSAGVERRDALQAGAQRILQLYGGVIPPAEHGVASGVHGLVTWAPAIASAWAENAFATIDLGHKLAAAFAATSLPREYAKDVKMPWRCFRVVVPAGVLNEHEASILTLHSTTGEFLTITANGPGYLTMGHEPTFEGFVGMELFQRDAPALEIAANVNETNRRTIMLHQIVVGVCVELATRPLPRRPAHGSRESDGSDEPKIWRFQLTRPVGIDCRAAVRGFVEGAGRSPTVHTLVRGHYKRQPVGPGRAERKWIHVEPYWRGPDLAPIALRAHELDDDEE